MATNTTFLQALSLCRPCNTPSSFTQRPLFVRRGNYAGQFRDKTWLDFECFRVTVKKGLLHPLRRRRRNEVLHWRDPIQQRASRHGVFPSPAMKDGDRVRAYGKRDVDRYGTADLVKRTYRGSHYRHMLLFKGFLIYTWMRWATVNFFVYFGRMYLVSRFDSLNNYRSADSLSFIRGLTVGIKAVTSLISH